VLRHHALLAAYLRIGGSGKPLNGLLCGPSDVVRPCTVTIVDEIWERQGNESELCIAALQLATDGSCKRRDLLFDIDAKCVMIILYVRT